MENTYQEWLAHFSGENDEPDEPDEDDEQVPGSAGVGEYTAAKVAVGEAEQDSEAHRHKSPPSTPEKVTHGS